MHNVGKNHCIIAAGIDSLTFPVRDIERVDLLWWDQQLACWSLVTLFAQSASLQVSAVANHKLPVEKPLGRFECPQTKYI
ncbi:MAG: hypothetical protein H0U27_12030 [Nitrosopumilus sp.]|nr:hypothetical protein [Nitrosopumilus sp.]